MKDILKIALGFVAGAGVGLGVGKVYFEKKYQQIADEEIESVKECYHKALKQKEVKEEMTEKIFEQADERPAKKSKDEEDISKAYKSSEPETVTVNAFDVARENIDKIMKSVNADTDRPQEDTAEEPYMITETEFYETNDTYDKVVLHFYMNDGYLVNENDDVVELANTIGVDAYDLLSHADEAELYYRNDRTGEDYEVIRLYSSYVSVESSAEL